MSDPGTLTVSSLQPTGTRQDREARGIEKESRGGTVVLITFEIR